MLSSPKNEKQLRRHGFKCTHPSRKQHSIAQESSCVLARGASSTLPLDEGAERFEGSHRGEAAATSNEDAERDSEAMGMDESTGA